MTMKHAFRNPRFALPNAYRNGRKIPPEDRASPVLWLFHSTAPRPWKVKARRRAANRAGRRADVARRIRARGKR